MITRFTLLGLALLLLAGCTGAPPRPQPLDREQAWQLRQQALGSLHSWSLSGRLGIQTGHEGWHMSISWEQRQGGYTIRITAPLGQGSLLLEGDTSGVLLQTSDGESVRAEDPGLLLYQQFGWRVPVAALRYWVLGLPAPGEAQRSLDEYGRLSHLQQSGWEIDFLDYENRQGIELPGRVFVNNHNAKVRLVIGDWQLAGPRPTDEGS
jgi:outer membrane lipoprotein LolB